MVVPDPMLLTIPSPAKAEFEFNRNIHAFPSRIHSTSALEYFQQQQSQSRRLSKPVTYSSSPSSEDQKHHRASTTSSVSGFLSVALEGTAQKMSASHRGLPPPGQLALPDPGSRSGLPGPSHHHPPPPPPPPPPQQQPQIQPSQQHYAASSSLASLPPLPINWQSSEQASHWLAAKAEEEKRRAEEERSKQEEIRLERRKIEHSMLTESMRNGVPPYLLPIVFLGIAGTTPEWIQQYMGQIVDIQRQFAPFQQQQQQAGPTGSPEATRSAVPPSYTGGPALGQPGTVPQTPVSGSGVAYVFSGSGRPGDPATTMRGSYPTTFLPRLSSGDASQQFSSSVGPGGPMSTSQQQEQSSPILFHHWQPPTSAATTASSAKDQGPATPSEYASSPKKRKTISAHQSNPAPSSRTTDSTTNITAGRRMTTTHSRHRSDVSLRAMMSDTPQPPVTARTTPIERQQTPTQQQWPSASHQQQQSSHPVRPPLPPTSSSQSQYGQSSKMDDGGTPYDSQRSSQHQTMPGSAPHSTPASDERGGTTSEDIEMSER